VPALLGRVQLRCLPRQHAAQGGRVDILRGRCRIVAALSRPRRVDLRIERKSTRNDTITGSVASSHVLAETENPIGDSRETPSLDISEAIRKILRCFDDPTVRVVVLKRAGDKGFPSAADISQFKTPHSFGG
jgi:hypothetical protein